MRCVTVISIQSCEFSVRVSFLEIYNEELIDLLGAESVDSPKLKVYEDVMKKVCMLTLFAQLKQSMYNYMRHVCSETLGCLVRV